MTSDEWQPLADSPPPRGLDLEIAVVERDGSVNAVVEPAFWTGEGWLSVDTEQPLDLQPTHWRRWPWAERIHI